MIVVEPLAGLCNRMRMLDGAISLSRELDRELHVVWTLRADMPCRFDELFEVPACFASLRHVSDPTPWRWTRLLSYGFKYQRYFDRKEVTDLLQSSYSFFKISDYRTVAIRTCERFYPSRPAYADFVPVPAIQKVITGYHEVGELVGVHIRRTDSRLSIATSPTSKFIELMREELDLDSTTRFFLATDSPEEEATLQNLFPGRIVTHRKVSLARHDPRAVKDAAVDLYCLANCRKLIGSYFSSFTDTAAEIRGIQLKIAA